MTTQDNNINTQDDEQEKIEFPIKFWELKEIFEEHDYDEKQLEKYFILESPQEPFTILDDSQAGCYCQDFLRKHPFTYISEDNIKDIIYAIKRMIEIEMYYAKEGCIDIDLLEEDAEIFLELDRKKGKTFVCIDYCYRDEFEGYRYCDETDSLLRLIQCKDCEAIEVEYDDYDGCGLRKGCCVKCAKKYPMDNITTDEYNEIINDYDITKEEEESLELLKNPSRFETSEDWEKVIELMKMLDDYNYLLERCF